MPVTALQVLSSDKVNDVLLHALEMVESAFEDAGFPEHGQANVVTEIGPIYVEYPLVKQFALK